MHCKVQSAEGGAEWARAPERFDHIDRFRDGIGRVCGSFDVYSLQSDGAVAAELSLRRFADYDVAEISLSSLRTERTRRTIRRNDKDSIFIILQDAGSSSLCEDETTVGMRKGDLFIYDSAHTAKFEFATRSRHLSFQLTRQEAQARFGRRLRSGVCLRREAPVSLAMRSILRCLVRGDQSAVMHSALTDAYLCLLSAHFNEQDGTDDKPQLLSAALDAIEASWMHPGFGPHELAQKLGVSLRTLQRAFAMIGETPRQRIMATRLEHAHRSLALAKHRNAERKIVDVAFSHGFNDLSYFYRTFRDRFGIAPGEIARGTNRPRRPTAAAE